jgi:hypothetical protein
VECFVAVVVGSDDREGILLFGKMSLGSSIYYPFIYSPIEER